MKKSTLKKKQVKSTGIQDKFQDVLQEAHKTFSLYKRLLSANKDGLVQCYTCATKMHYKYMHLGHYINRDYLRTAFLDENKIQCPTCNVSKDGNLEVYAVRLKAEYGDDVIDRLEFLKIHGKLYDKIDLLEKIAFWKESIKKTKQTIDKLDYFD